MSPLRWLAALLVHGPNAEFIKHDLDDMYARDLACGMATWRARWRYARYAFGSAFSVWRGDRPWPPAPAGEWRREMRGGTMFQDLRFALRLFRRHPAPVAIAIGGLALAIGVAAAVFSIVNATMLRSYGMDDPASIVRVRTAGSRWWSGWPYAQFLQMHDGTTLGAIEASRDARVRFSTASVDDGGANRLILFVSGGYLGMLGGRPSLGRALEPSDDLPGAPPVIVVSHHFWKTELGGDPAAVGRTVWVNGTAVALVGVLQPHFTGPVATPPFAWVPFAAFDDVLAGPAFSAIGGAPVDVIAKLGPGVAPSAAEQNLTTIVTRAAAPASNAAGGTAKQAVRLTSATSPLDEPGNTDAYVGMACVFGITGLVLALACANAANLLMAAAVTRQREIGVRLAMGASRGRIVRQMVNESMLLGLMAGGLGLLLAFWLVPIFGALVRLSPELNLAPDGRALLFAVAVSLVCGVGAGLSPARYGARGNVLVALQSQGGARGGAMMPSRLRTSFIGFQAAVSILLLVFATLLARTAIVTLQADIGFDADRLLVVGLRPVRSGIDQWSYLQQARAALRELPSVDQMSVVEDEPFGWSRSYERFRVDGRSYQLRLGRSDGDFFATAGVRLLRGRTFTDDEALHEAPVALISDSVARTFFHERDPIGQPVSTIPQQEREPATIIGIVADAMLDGPESQRSGAIYRPLHRADTHQGVTDQGYPIPPSLIVRTASPGVAARKVENALRRINSGVTPTASVLRDRLDEYFGGKRMLATLLVPAALLALALAALGMYGVTAFVVGQRTHEVSVRMAIGASSADVLHLLVRDNLRPVFIGLGAGLIVALIGSRLSARMLMISGISPNDPLSIGLATSILLACAVVAVITPARRAARTDPANLLRHV